MRSRGADIQYYAPGRKRPIIGSTRATSDFLALIHNLQPTYTIAELRALITDKTRFIPNPDAIAVLNAYITAGFESCIPDWR